MAGKIRVGIGGWNFEPWRGVFYPKGLKQAEELGYASRHVTSIEINSTYYSSQKPESFARWAAETPEGFVFAVKASRFATNRKVMAEGAESVSRFLNQGIDQLGSRLGPILWQLAPTKKFNPDEFAAFFDLLPEKLSGLALRHVIEPRHATFADPAFVALCRERGIAICVSENEKYPIVPDVTADFVYCRLLKGDDAIPTGYPPDQLDEWTARFKAWASGAAPDDLTPIDPGAKVEKRARDVFAYVIHEGKVRAPAAAMAFIERLG